MEVPDGWTENPVYRSGQKVGWFCVLENEIHCYRLEGANGNWITRQDLERLTMPLFKKYGNIITKVRKINVEGQKFVTRLGFKVTADDETNIYYRTERLHHARL